MVPWETIRTFILVLGWPVLVVGSGFVLRQALWFHRTVERNVLGRLVLGMVVGWLVTMYSLGVTATAFMIREPDTGVPTVLPIFVLWFATMVGIVGAVLRWGREASTLQALYRRMEALVEERTRALEEEVRFRRATEERLAASARRLEQSNQDLERFAVVASHDLQAPLYSIRLFLKELDEGSRARLDPEGRRSLEAAISGAARMQNLVEDLLAYSRVTGEQPTGKPVHMAKVLSEVLTDLGPALRESGAQVTYGDLPELPLNASHLRSLLANLVGNAVKFRRADEAPRIHIDAVRQGPEWVLSVRDNGTGIDPVLQARLFQMFGRLQSPSKIPGSGIGLATCKRLADLYRGRIWVESRPGVGSTFYVSLRTAKLGGLSAAAPADARTKASRTAPSTTVGGSEALGPSDGSSETRPIGG